MFDSPLATIIINDVRHYLPLELERYFIAASVMAAIVWMARRTPLRSRAIQPRTASSADLRREIGSSLIACLIYLVVTIGIDWAIHAGMFPYDKRDHSLAYLVMMFCLIVLAHDAYFYWTHRAMHTRWLYRRIHRHHHKSVTPTPWTAYSFSVPEAALNAGFMAVWLAFVPTPGIVTLVFMGAQITRNVTAHAGLEFHPRWWLSTPLTRWISATTHHDLHHSGGFNHNFGFWFTFWDKLMGTEHPRYRETFARVTAPAANAPKPSTLHGAL